VSVKETQKETKCNPEFYLFAYLNYFRVNHIYHDNNLPFLSDITAHFIIEEQVAMSLQFIELTMII